MTKATFGNAASAAMGNVNGPGKPKWKVSRTRYAISLIALVLVGFVFAAFALGHIGNYEVISNSMAPTLFKGDRVIVDQRPHLTTVGGDVVALRDPENPVNLMTKRIVAVEGQTVEVIDGHLNVNGKPWAPPGLPTARIETKRTREPMTVPKDQVFVVGDNVNNSEDSLVFGSISAESVKGKLLFIYWPPSRMGRVH